MEEKEIREEEILDENISETTEDVDSLLKSAPQKLNMKDEEMEDQMVNKQDDGVEFQATWPLHDDMKKTLTNDFTADAASKPTNMSSRAMFYATDSANSTVSTGSRTTRTRPRKKASCWWRRCVSRTIEKTFTAILRR